MVKASLNTSTAEIVFYPRFNTFSSEFFIYILPLTAFNSFVAWRKFLFNEVVFEKKNKEEIKSVLIVCLYYGKETVMDREK